MTALSWTLWLATGACTLADWFAVLSDSRRAEFVLKPGTMVLLIGATLALHPDVPAMRWWFVGALVCSLAGDVFLMFKEPKLFVPGLASFLVGHVCFIAGFAASGLTGRLMVKASVAVVVFLAGFGTKIVLGSRKRDARLTIPVTLYMLTIGAMFVTAAGSGRLPAVIGAALFVLSDTFIGRSRFVNDFMGSRLAIIVTYHVAQLLLVASLVVTNPTR